MFWEETYFQLDPVNPINGNYSICVKETWPSEKIHTQRRGN